MDSFKLEVWKSEFEDTYNKYRDNKNELKYQEDIIPYRFLEVLIENIRIDNFEWLVEYYIDIKYIDRFIEDILNYKIPIYKSEEYFQDIRELEGLIEEELEDTHIFFNNER